QLLYNQLNKEIHPLCLFILLRLLFLFPAACPRTCAHATAGAPSSPRADPATCPSTGPSPSGPRACACTCG
ncbi:MAG: hypothetical protein AAFR15_17585, partial [Cyanobacteria bacterium J06627_15]